MRCEKYNKEQFFYRNLGTQNVQNFKAQTSLNYR